MPASSRALVAMRAVALAAALAAVTASSAGAESAATPQTRSAGVDWIQGVPAERWPAPADRRAICLIDTGVAVTPDTPADNPDGPIVARLSITDGEPGTPAAQDPNGMHGTMLAAAMAAPRNGWGIVGVWPGARIISVRASMPTGGILDQSILTAVIKCRNWAFQNGLTIAVVNLSLGTSTPASSVTDQLMEARVSEMQELSKASFVGSAGNDSGTTMWPASVKGILAVAATDLGGGWCPSASRDWRTVLAAPGCGGMTGPNLVDGSEGTWEGGSSNAAAMVSATIAALRSLRPDATREQVEQWVTGNGTQMESARRLDGRAIADAAGLGDLKGLAPLEPTAPSQDRPVFEDTLTQLASDRRVRVRFRRGRITVTGKAPIKGVRLQVAVRKAARWQTSTRPTTVKLKASSRPARIWVRWIGPDAQSSWASYKRPKSAAARYWNKERKPHGLRPPDALGQQT